MSSTIEEYEGEDVYRERDVPLGNTSSFTTSLTDNHQSSIPIFVSSKTYTIIKMVSFSLSTLTTLALAALASARPASDDKTSAKYFSLALIAKGYPRLSLNAIQSAVLGSYDLVFERPSAYPGTPAILNGTKLDFHIKDPNQSIDYYATYFEEVGDSYGTTVPATAIFGNDEGRTGFGFRGGKLYARMEAAFEHFFACNETLNGKEQFGLKWGVFEANGSSPEGCVAAELIQNFNVLESEL